MQRSPTTTFKIVFALKMKIWLEKNLKKFKKDIKKCRISRWFQIRWKSFKKWTQKKLLTKQIWWTWVKVHFYLCMFMKFVWLITFFVWIFLKLFQQIWNQREILRFLTSFLIISIFFFCHISTFFKFWSQLRKKRLKKLKKCIL